MRDAALSEKVRFVCKPLVSSSAGQLEAGFLYDIVILVHSYWS